MQYKIPEVVQPAPKRTLLTLRITDDDSRISKARKVGGPVEPGDAMEVQIAERGGAMEASTAEKGDVIEAQTANVTTLGAGIKDIHI